MQSYTVSELKAALSAGESFQLIDVREPFEHDTFNIGGTLIPLSDIFDNVSLINPQGKVILYCQKGIRSQIAIQRLQQKYGFTNLYNLIGGMEAWKKQHP